MTTKELLVETLDQLSAGDFWDFKLFMVAEKFLPPDSRRELEAANTEAVAELMMRMCRGRCVEETRKILLKMRRQDLLHRLAGVRENPSLIQRAGVMASDLELLMETLSALSGGGLREFWERYLLLEPSALAPPRTDPEIAAISLVQSHGKQSVDVTRRILVDINQNHLVQSLLDCRPRNRKPPDDRRSALIHKAATMAAVKEILLETLMDLNHLDLGNFKIFLNFESFQNKFPQISWSDLKKSNCKNMVDLLMGSYGRQCLEVTRQVLMDMNRTDLLEKLPEKSCGAEEKLSVEELWPGLIDKVEAMESVIELLLETVGDLSEEEQMFFITLLGQSQRDVADRLLAVKELLPAVLVMVQMFGQRSVQMTRQVLKRMRRTDLLPDISASRRPQAKKLSADQRSSAALQKVALIAAFKQLLTEILSDLKKQELEDFKKSLRSTLSLSGKNLWYPSMRLRFGPFVPNVANEMVEELGLQSVEVSMEILMDINRSDLAERLLETSSGLKGKVSIDEYQRVTMLNTVPGKMAVRSTLLKMMMELGHSDVWRFKRLLQFTCFQKSLPELPVSVLWPMNWTGRAADPGLEGPADLVDQMVKRLGGESVGVAQEVLMDMNRTDVVQKLAGIRSGSTEEFQSLLFQKEASLTAIMEKLLETFEDLGEAKFEHFQRVVQKSLSRKAGRGTVAMETGRKLKVAELMLEQFDEQTLDMAALVLKQIHRSDLVQKISGNIPAGPSGPSRVAKGREEKLDSSCWTELVPEVNQTESPTYSLQSEAGLFECSVSGLRWFCSERVVFRYRFCSWDGHMERMESRGYRPAGPLLDISLITGRMTEVFLPHWICVDDVRKPLEQFAVLHMDDCGDAVEKVSEVSPSHVKLAEPVFSPRAVLMRAGFPVKVYCNMLLYRTNTAFLTLHVYLIPRDPALQQAMDRKESSYGYKVIQKPDPEKSLKMNDYFFLTSDLEAAEVSPKMSIKAVAKHKVRQTDVVVKSIHTQKIWKC
uniref:FIIND domain-containing protein n=1 Tax=Poecilia mexicana TaxID=48701 RepID=A0A3B3WQM1_9TELE